MAGTKSALNDRQRRFAAFLVGGKTPTDAYLAAYPENGKRRKYATNNAWRLQRKPYVAEYIRKLREEATRAMKMEMIASRQEVAEFYTDVLRTPAGRVSADSPLCASFYDSPKVKVVRMPAKLVAADRLCRMMGWDVPPRAEEKKDGLLELLEAIRAGNPPKSDGGSED